MRLANEMFLRLWSHVCRTTAWLLLAGIILAITIKFFVISVPKPIAACACKLAIDAESSKLARSLAPTLAWCAEGVATYVRSEDFDRSIKRYAFFRAPPRCKVELSELHEFLLPALTAMMAVIASRVGVRFLYR
jgi:hypothetical protein